MKGECRNAYTNTLRSGLEYVPGQINHASNTASVTVATITEYQANNKGNLPNESLLQNCNFLEDNTDPASAVSFICTYSYIASGPDKQKTIKTSLRLTCDGKTTSRGFSVSTLLSTGERYCADG